MDDATPHEQLKPTALAKAVEISVPYASQILSGDRVPAQGLAIRIYRVTGHKLGPIASATDDEIEVLERFQGAA